MDENELKSLGTCNFEKLRTAIKTGDTENALELLDEVMQGVEF